MKLHDILRENETVTHVHGLRIEYRPGVETTLRSSLATAVITCEPADARGGEVLSALRTVTRDIADERGTVGRYAEYADMIRDRVSYVRHAGRLGDTEAYLAFTNDPLTAAQLTAAVRLFWDLYEED